MALLDRLLRRNRRPSQMDEASFSFEPVGHASAVRFLELDGKDDAPTVEMDLPPVMDLGYEVPRDKEADVFLNIAADAHREAHLSIPKPVCFAEGSGTIEIDFDD